MKRHSSFVLYSEKRNLKDCCGLPLHKTTTRWVAVTSRSSTFTFSLIGQGNGSFASIFTESFGESQKKSGTAAVFAAFLGTGDMHMEPGPVSAGNVELNRSTAERITMFFLNMASQQNLARFGASAWYALSSISNNVDPVKHF